MEIKLQGFAELQRKLAEFGPKLEKNGQRAAARAAAAVFRDAIRQTAPVRTGFLKSQLVVNARRSKDGPYMARYSARIKPGKKVKYANTSQNRRLKRVGKKYSQEGPAFYGKFLEFGSSKQRARPFMRPAFGPNVDKALSAFKARMAKAVEMAAREK